MKGMCDEVRFDFRMPDGYSPGNRYYQTTDLGCDCHQYIIESGRLLRTSDIDGNSAGEDMEFSGMLNIYASEPIPETVRGIWREYHLEFIDGTLKVIHCGSSPPRKPQPWTAEMDALLGTDNDSKIASRLGLSRNSVTDRRAHLGISGFVSSPTNWTPAMDALLGGNTLKAVANHLGIPVSRVQKRMRELNLPAFMPLEKRTIQWTAAKDQAIVNGATAPLAKLAQTLGVGPDAISARKMKIGVPSVQELKWFDTVELALLCFETYLDGKSVIKVAEENKLTRSQVDRLISKMIRLVWYRLPDRTIAVEHIMEEMRKNATEWKRCARHICAETTEKRAAFVRRVSPPAAPWAAKPREPL